MSDRWAYHHGNGPYHYDDTDDITQDDDGDPSDLPSGTKCHALITDHQLLVGSAPTAATHVLRLGDGSLVIPSVTGGSIDNPILNSYNSQLVLVIGLDGAGNTVMTLYGFAAGASDTPVVPFRVQGLAGIYVAIAGHNIAS